MNKAKARRRIKYTHPGLSLRWYLQNKQQERPRLPLVTVLGISKPPPLFVQLLPNEALRRCRLTLASFPPAEQQLHLGFRAALLPAPAPPLVLGPRVVRWLLEHFEMCDGSASTLAQALQVGWLACRLCAIWS
jgi:hypothetical protein